MDNTGEKIHDHRIQRWFRRFVRSRMAKALVLGAVLKGMIFWSLYLYITSFHRLKSILDIKEAMNIMRMPISKDLDRCRDVNATHMKCLPNVFFIGASKCGTTSIIEYLQQQERVKLVSRRLTPTDRHREIHRFDRNTYDWAIPWLELGDEWASSPSIPQNDPGYSVVHYTPHYLYAPSVPFDMKKLYPHSDDASQMKFIVVLRDPVARALSSYWFSQSHLFEDRRKKGEKKGNIGSIGEFQTLATQEMESRSEYDACMRESTTGDLQAKLKHCFGEGYRSPSLGGRHVDKGVYYDQLVRWFEVFEPSSFFITSLESISQDPAKVMKEMLHFIGADKDKDGNEVKIVAYGDEGVSKKALVHPNDIADSQPLPSAFHERLTSFYQPYMRKLHTLLAAKFAPSQKPDFIL